jgi:hypothetical protein
MKMRASNWARICAVLGCVLLTGSWMAMAQSGSDTKPDGQTATQDSQAIKPDQQAQTTPDTATKPDQQVQPAPDTATKVPEEPVRTNTDSYAVSLGTGQIISMSGQSADGEFVVGKLGKTRPSEFKNQFFYGLTASSVYTNSFQGVGPQSVYSTSFSPYLAILVPTKTGSFVAQYNAVVNPNDTSTGDPQAYHTATFKADGAFTRRWSWELTETGSYGSESARFQAPLTYSVVQTTPVADANAALLLRTKNVSFSEGSARAAYLMNSRDAVGFTVTHTYTGIAGDPTAPNSVGTHSNSVGAKFDYARTLSPKVVLKAYGTSDMVVFGPTCNSFGGGVGVSVKVNHAIGFDVQGGPQKNSAGCGGQQNANFSGNIVGTFRNGDRLYASANRTFSTAFRVDGHWEDNATVGYTKTIKRLTLTGDAGVVRGELLPGSTTQYRGYFITPHTELRMTKSLGISGGYRSFRGNGGALVAGNESFAFVSVDFYPAGIHF